MATQAPTIDIQIPSVDLIDPVNERDLHALASEEAFMNEPVEIFVHPVSDENAPPYVILNVNGVSQPVARGTAQTVKRKFVEVLARAKQTGIKTVVDMSNGEPVNRIHRHTGLRYPFSIQHDPNPKGAAWLRGILAQG